MVGREAGSARRGKLLPGCVSVDQPVGRRTMLGVRLQRGRDDQEGTPLAIRGVRLGSPRAPGEGLRLGTVRRPPRGVPKTEHASRNFYDVWLPELAPTEGLLKQALNATDE